MHDIPSVDEIKDSSNAGKGQVEDLPLKISW
jgi:hypothetical protein